MPYGHAESNDLLRNRERNSEFGVLALARRYATKFEDLPLNSNLLESFISHPFKTYPSGDRFCQNTYQTV